LNELGIYPEQVKRGLSQGSGRNEPTDNRTIKIQGELRENKE
jgi:hypothetical protein